jgi:hypothetical protein
MPAGSKQKRGGWGNRDLQMQGRAGHMRNEAVVPTSFICSSRIRLVRLVQIPQHGYCQRQNRGFLIC